MKKNPVWEKMDDVRAEFRLLVSGHVPVGCSNGWVLQPFSIFIVTLQGFAETIYRDREQGIIPRPESSVAYVRANEARRSVTKSPEGVDYIAVGFSFEYHGYADFLNQFWIPSVLPPHVQEEMRGTILELAASEERNEPFWRKQIVRKKYGYCLLDLLLTCSERNFFPDDDWRRLQPAIEYLNEHYRDNFDIDELLRRSSLSRVHFYRIFRRRFHLAPQEYMISLRLREAAGLLLNSDLSVAEIGREVGWDNPFYFSKVFKSVIGVSPLHYRKNPGGMSGEIITLF